MGDDTTDEDAFKVIQGKGLSICIGGSPEAEYYLKNQGEIKRFLEWRRDRQVQTLQGF